MLIAIKGAEDFADVPSYLPGIHFDAGVFIFYENFHKGIEERSRS